jgi:hypothetical protein
MKNPHAVALGRLGGLKGGPAGGRARASALPPARRVEIAREAARARWTGISPALSDLFPGYRIQDLTLPRDVDLVMLHVLTRGGPEHRSWLIRRFGNQGIRNWIREHRGRGLTIRQMAPWIPSRTARNWQASSPYALLWENR